jgi:hypothetical protein
MGSGSDGRREREEEGSHLGLGFRSLVARSLIVGGSQQRSGGFRSWRRGGRGAGDHGESDDMLGDVDRFLERRRGAAGAASGGGELRAWTFALICCEIERTESTRRCARMKERF